MNNIEFLNKINANIYKIEDLNNKYFVYIPFVEQSTLEESYINKYLSNGVYIELINTLFDENSEINIEESINNYDENNELFFRTNPNYILSEVIQSKNYVYYATLNELKDKNIEENEILNFYQTFMNILSNANVQNTELLKTQIYQKVIEFYKNGQIDETLINLKLILKGVSLDYVDTSSYTTCGCNQSVTGSNTTITNASGIVTTSDCVTAYTESMYMYLVQMFKDLDFYNNFMFIDNDPNVTLIDSLYDLIEDLKKLNINLDVDKSSNNHCYCEEINTKNSEAYKILDDFQKVLMYVKNCEIEENINKIKIYGGRFGEIFPKLQF